MSLSPDSTDRSVIASTSVSQSTIVPEMQSKTLSSALTLLTALKPRIMAILGDHKLCVPLDRMDIMKPDRGDLDKAHVLWLGPSLESQHTSMLSEVCGMY
jgi:activating signal cointegrator complex subunit 1